MRPNRIACLTSAATLSSHIFSMTSALYVSIVRTLMFSAAYRRSTRSKGRAASQPIELLADMSCLRRSIGKRDGAIERHPRLLGAAELEQECAPRAVEVEVAAELARGIPARSSETRFAHPPRPPDATADSVPQALRATQILPGAHDPEIPQLGRPPRKWILAPVVSRRPHARSPAARDCPQASAACAAMRSSSAKARAAL